MGNLQTAEQTWPTVPGAELLNLGRAYRRPLG
ncbi:MAG TPA: energy transducer TonB, partial [Pseudomonas sp.]|nr:energy transducer TonB [Pseudomonas sp.]